MKSISFIGIGLVVLASALTSQRCEPSRKPSRFLIPDGYVGWVNIYFEIKDAPPLTIEEGHYVFRIPPAGTMSTSSKLEGGIAVDDYYYVDKQGNRRPLESTSWGEGGMIWAESTGNDANGITYSRFFVGTESLLQDYGFKMNKKLGPIPQQSGSPR